MFERTEINGPFKKNLKNNFRGSAKTKVPIGGDVPETSKFVVKGEVPSLENGDLNQLMHKVSLLESRLSSEAKEKTHLAQEVAALREENLRLQEESQTAAQQLKKFTDWFFQAIDNA